MDYFIRVRMSWFMIQPACEQISSKVEKMIVYEHSEDPENTHVHMYLVGTQVSTDTLKNYIRHKRGGNDRGNKFWSFKTATDSGCISYMTKGKYDPVYVKGFTPEEINAHKLAGYDKPKPAGKVMYVVKETHKDSKLRQSEMIDKIVKKLKSKDDYTPEAILEQIRQVVIIDNNTIIGRYKVRDYYDTIRARLLTKETWICCMKNFCCISL